MSELLGTTVDALVGTMKERRVRLPSEIGAFLALEVCEALLDGPAAVRLEDVRIAEDGTISVFAPPGSATSEEAARSVVALLGALLVAAGTGVPRALVGLLERGPSSGRWDLSSLRDDLEASLVPLNRAAARRVLARMIREVRKPRSAPPKKEVASAPPPGDPTLDAQLDDLLGAGGASAPSPATGPAPDDLDAELDATIDELSVPAPAAARPSPAPRAVSRPADPPDSDATIADESPPDVQPRRGPSRAPADPPPSKRSRAEAVDELEALGSRLDAPDRGSPLPWILAIVAIVAATAAALALMRPDLVDAIVGRPPPPPEPAGPTEAERERTRQRERGRFGTLVVRAQPERAQVLLYVGRGPAVATDLPIGVAHEFVAIADGRGPSRAVLPADAEWEETEGGRRYELAMQASDDPMEAAELDLGPTRLPQDVGSPSGALGDVRVITNPPGAKVYVLVGFSPDVTVQNVRTDEAVELLVYHEGHPVERVLVGPSDWQSSEDGTKRATVDVALE